MEHVQSFPNRYQPDVLLVQPPMDYAPWSSGVGECLGLELLATVLRHEGYTVKILDAFLLSMNLEQIVQAMVIYKPRLLLGFSIQAMDMYERTREVLNALPLSYQGTFTVVGGHAPTFWYKEILSDCPQIDVVVRVEGEETVLELMEVIQFQRRLRDVAGIAYRKSGDVVLTAPRQLIKDLSSLPLIQRDTLRFGMRHMEMAPDIHTSRGCFGSCSFCSLHSFYGQHPGPRIRWRNTKDVLAELEHLYYDYGARFIRFEDDTFLTRSRDSHARAIEICDELIRRNLRMRFVIQLRADAVHKKTLEKLKHAGLVQATVGVEALDNSVLSFYGKKTAVATNRRAAEVLAELGIRFRVCYITFNPYTTVAHLHNSIRFFRGLKGPHQCAHIFNRLYVLRGTPMEKALNRAGILLLHRFRYDYDFQDPVIAQLWPHCEAYVEVFSPAKQEIGALWEWWYQFGDQFNQAFEQRLQSIDHGLTDCHLDFLELSLKYVIADQHDRTEELLNEMSRRIAELLAQLESLKETASRDSAKAQFRFYHNYVFDPVDLDYGLSNDLTGDP